MESIFKIILIVFLILGLGIFAYSFSYRPKNDKEETSFRVGAYCAEITVDFSSGWASPTVSKKVTRNELGISTSCEFRNAVGSCYKEGKKYQISYEGILCFDIQGLKDSPMGKTYSIVGYTAGDDFYRSKHPVEPIDNSNFYSNVIKAPFNVQWLSDTKNFSTNSKAVINLTIMSYLER